MSLFSAPDDIAQRARLAGKSTKETIAERVRNSPTRRLETQEKNRPVVDKANNRTEFARSWRRMVRLASNSHTWREALEAVAIKHGTTVEEMRGERRFANMVQARREASYILRNNGYSYPEIGRKLDKDHSTIIHCVKSYEAKRPVFGVDKFRALGDIATDIIEKLAHERKIRS